MKPYPKGTRVVHYSRSPMRGTVTASGHISKCCRVVWDDGTTSVVFQGVLALAKKAKVAS